MALFFVSGNLGKFAEIQALVPEIELLALDLVEIQASEGEAIVRAKLAAARSLHAGDLLVEDTSLHLDALGGLPGPFVKWFLEAIGAAGLADLALKLGEDRATARTIVGYAPAEGEVAIFEGAVSGRIVAPRGDRGFGWDPVFVPEGSTKSFAQMDPEEKQALSMRRIALERFARFRSRAAS